jgi:aspartyl-tRNA synthetase
LTRDLLQFTVLGIGMIFRDDYYEVVETIESMLVFVFRGLQERRQYRYLTEIVKRLYPTARQFRIGLDEYGKVPRITFIEAKRVLREELGFEADDKRNFTSGRSSHRKHDELNLAINL